MTVALTFLLSFFAIGAAAPEEVRHAGSFITTLGNETVAFESYVRTSEKLEGDILLRVPGTTRYHYKLTFAKDGSVRTSEFTIKPIGAPGVDENRRLSLNFDRDSVRITSVIQGEPQSVTRPSGSSPTVLFLGGYASSHGLYGSFGMYEHVFTRLDPKSAEVVQLDVVSADTGKASTRRFKRVSSSAIDVDYFKMAWTHVQVNDAGEIVSADATGTTEPTTTKRVEYAEVDRLEKEYAALDKSGKGVGEASPNVETKAAVGNASIVLRYGSPRLRGRAGIQGAIVASGRVWRTGANQATTLETNRDLMIGEVRLAAGKYSLWTLARPDGVLLIVNKETGQWGTSYKQPLDLGRVPMRVDKTEAPLENFTIAIEPVTGGHELRITWDTFRWSAPITVAPR